MNEKTLYLSMRNVWRCKGYICNEAKFDIGIFSILSAGKGKWCLISHAWDVYFAPVYFDHFTLPFLVTPHTNYYIFILLSVNARSTLPKKNTHTMQSITRHRNINCKWHMRFTAWNNTKQPNHNIMTGINHSTSAKMLFTLIPTSSQFDEN